MATSNSSSFSWVLILSYVVDWIIIIGIAAVGAGFSQVTPHRRAFDLTDPDLSFPLTNETITTPVLVVIGLIIPAGIVFVGSLLIPFGSQNSTLSRGASWRRKLWEWNTGWMGLGLAIAVSFMIVSGAKEVAGKPRPDLLARCKPDLSRLVNATVGGIGQQLQEGTVLVTYEICGSNDPELDEGFRSFPSGHATISFAGLTYLALWLCAKLSITIPFLTYSPVPSKSTGSEYARLPLRSQSAAPPLYLTIFPLFCICLATYVSLTRYSDYWHHGFDIIVGALLGIASAFLGFYWYHLPISRGGGWAWAPRHQKHAFGHGLGGLTYGEPHEGYTGSSGDLELGPTNGWGAAPTRDMGGPRHTGAGGAPEDFAFSNS